MEQLPGRVECTASSKLVSSDGRRRRRSTSLNVVGFFVKMEVTTSKK